MIHFTTTILQFAAQGEKTGWSYIEVPVDLAEDLNPGVKKSYRVKGKLDKHAIKGMALIPMGGGKFIMPVNATTRKAIAKKKGARLEVSLQVDKEVYQVNETFLECLRDEPKAIAFFEKLPRGHQNYFSKWIETAKTEETRARRIALAVNALAKGWGFSEMMRANKK
jgi:hypothetical protein